MFYQHELEWAAEAERLAPVLFHETRRPQQLIETVKDETVWQGYRTRAIGKPEEVYNRELPDSWEYCFDFGDYCVGTIAFDFDYSAPVDAPFRLEVKMAETPYELAYDFSTYNAPLGRGWLQDALLVEDQPGKTLTLPRRYAFRYIKLKVTCNSIYYKAILRDIRCDAVTSADHTQVQPYAGTDPVMQEIDRIGIKTLSLCMQDVFEDSPKRDRRLWSGDLRIQALANYQTFRNFALVKRSLLLLAAGADEDGRVPGCVFPASPRPVGQVFFQDYRMLFGDILLDYVKASSDLECGRELFPVAARQCRIGQEDEFFIDWKAELDRECAGKCCFLYGLMRGYELAELLDLTGEVADWPSWISRLRQEIREKYFDEKNGFFISGSERQISWASQVWAANACILPLEENRKLLRRTLNAADIIPPGGPFMYNQMVIALEKVQLFDEALNLTRNFWGKMLDLGADCFWEVFTPEDPRQSPYREPAINSHCHGWSVPLAHRPIKE